mmetsp:Transcript_153674/g.268768  ORF Transcript_153674/g.268768 Transcript_153674/m.268768 type:complete len:348 (-) Transcript_153674:215-1258(-)
MAGHLGVDLPAEQHSGSGVVADAAGAVPGHRRRHQHAVLQPAGGGPVVAEDGRVHGHPGAGVPDPDLHRRVPVRLPPYDGPAAVRGGGRHRPAAHRAGGSAPTRACDQGLPGAWKSADGAGLPAERAVPEREGGVRRVPAPDQPEDQTGGLPHRRPLSGRHDPVHGPRRLHAAQQRDHGQCPHHVLGRPVRPLRPDHSELRPAEGQDDRRRVLLCGQLCTAAGGRSAPNREGRPVDHVRAQLSVQVEEVQVARHPRSAHWASRGVRGGRRHWADGHVLRPVGGRRERGEPHGEHRRARLHPNVLRDVPFGQARLPRRPPPGGGGEGEGQSGDPRPEAGNCTKPSRQR